MANGKNPAGFFSLYIFRARGQSSLQATVDRGPDPRPVPIVRTGTSAPTGTATLIRRAFLARKG